MKSLLIIGAGGYGRVAKEIAELNGYTDIDFLDDNYSDSVGKISDVDTLQSNYDGCIIAIGNPDIREKVIGKIKKLATLIHPTAAVSKSAVIGDGCIVEANAVINTHAVIGRSTYICAGAVVNHDAIAGSYCQVDCNAVVAAGAALPDKTKVQSMEVWNQKL